MNKGIQNIKNQLFTFEGRIGRLKYTLWGLGSLLALCIGIPLAILSGVWVVEGMIEIERYNYGDYFYYSLSQGLIYLFWGTIGLLTGIPFAITGLLSFISHSIRRLRDLGFTAKYAWVLIILGINIFVLLLLCTLEGIKDNETTVSETLKTNN